MAKLKISPKAKADLQKIREYITSDLDNPEAARNTVARIVQSMHQLEKFPLSGALLQAATGVGIDYRYLVSGNYMTFYRCDGEDIYIVRVLYGKRDYVRVLFGDVKTE